MNGIFGNNNSWLIVVIIVILLIGLEEKNGCERESRGCGCGCQ